MPWLPLALLLVIALTIAALALLLFPLEEPGDESVLDGEADAEGAEAEIAAAGPLDPETDGWATTNAEAPDVTAEAPPPPDEPKNPPA